MDVKTAPPINWFGGYMVARDLLIWSKSGVEDENDKDSFISKMNRPNFIGRVQLITTALNQFGPTEQAAVAIQTLFGHGHGFFTQFSSSTIVDKMNESIERLGKGGVYKFSAAEFGTLDFKDVPGDEVDVNDD